MQLELYDCYWRLHYEREVGCNLRCTTTNADSSTIGLFHDCMLKHKVCDTIQSDLPFDFTRKKIYRFTDLSCHQAILKEDTSLGRVLGSLNSEINGQGGGVSS